MDTNGERYWEAELYRPKGKLLLQSGDRVQNQEQKSASSRPSLWLAASRQRRWNCGRPLSLSRLWRQQGKRAEGYQSLAEVYGWFTEGFTTADLQEARALLDALDGEDESLTWERAVLDQAL